MSWPSHFLNELFQWPLWWRTCWVSKSTNYWFLSEYATRVLAQVIVIFRVDYHQAKSNLSTFSNTVISACSFTSVTHTRTANMFCFGVTRLSTLTPNIQKTVKTELFHHLKKYISIIFLSGSHETKTARECALLLDLAVCLLCISLIRCFG